MADRHFIREFGAIYKGSDYPNTKDNFDSVFLSNKAFSNLKDFITDNTNPQVEVDQAFSVHRSRGKDFIKVKNYVGVIEVRGGTSIEILPKVNLKSDENPEIDTRQIFLKMLRHLRNSPFKTIDQAHLKTTRFPVLEVFITNFLSELTLLIKRGLKKHYINIEENSKVLKGRISFPDHLRQNLFRKDNFFISFDEFCANIPQNKIIKSTLILLEDKTKNPRNKTLIRNYLDLFDDVDKSINYHHDFSSVHTNSNRLYSHYDQILKWSRVFLLGESFTNFRGSSVNMAILFPMERIFEDFVGAMLRRNYPEYDVSLQDRKHYLVENHYGSKKFRIRPDMVMRKNGDAILVLDTKWKVIDQWASKHNYNISQQDMYQLYAYGKKYVSSEDIHPGLILIYPSNANFKEPLHFQYEDGLELLALPFDLEAEQGGEMIDLDTLKALQNEYTENHSGI